MINASQSNLYGIGNAGLGSFVSNIIGFQDVIKDTLKNDELIKQLKKNYKKSTNSNQIDNIAINNLYSQFQRMTMSVRELYSLMMSIRNVYITSAIVECISADSLSINPQNGQMFGLSINPEHPSAKKADKILKEMELRLHLDEMLKIITPEAIFYGEYFLTPVIDKDKKMIVKLLDNVMPGSAFAVYEGTEPQYFFKVRAGTGIMEASQTLEEIPVDELWHVTLWSQKLALSFDPNWTRPIKDQQLSHHLKVGCPLFYSTFDKIIELVGFEKGQLAKDLADVRRRSLVGVSAPEGLSLEQLDKFVAYYEGLLNDVNYDMNNVQGIDALNETFKDLGRVRAIPIQPSRGEINVIDTRNPGSGETSAQVEDRRNLICSAVCVPPEYIFGERDEARSSLRKFVRYARKVSDVQFGLSKGLKSLAVTELKLNGIDVTYEDVIVAFNSSINIQELDQLEFMDAKVTMLKGTKDFLMEMKEDETLSKFIDEEQMVKWLADHFSTIQGAEKLFKVPEALKDEGTKGS